MAAKSTRSGIRNLLDSNSRSPDRLRPTGYGVQSNGHLGAHAEKGPTTGTRRSRPALLSKMRPRVEGEDPPECKTKNPPSPSTKPPLKSEDHDSEDKQPPLKSEDDDSEDAVEERRLRYQRQADVDKNNDVHLIEKGRVLFLSFIADQVNIDM